MAFSAPTADESATAIAPGSNAPIRPVKVKTVTVKLVPAKGASANLPAPKPDPVRTAALAPSAPASSPQEAALVESLAAATPVEAATPASQPAAPGPGILGKLPAMMTAAKEAAVPAAKVEPTPAAKAEVKVAPSSHAKTEEHFPSAPSRQSIRSGWAIQVGAYEDQGEAKQHLSAAKSKISQVLNKAEAYIERTVKGAKTYYRARFAGFDRDQAEAVCKRLKREDVACMALKI